MNKINPPHLQTDPSRLSMAFWSINEAFSRRTYTTHAASRLLAAWYPDCAPRPELGWTLADVDDLISHAYYVTICMQPSMDEHLPISAFHPMTAAEHGDFGNQVILDWIREWARAQERRASCSGTN